MRLCARTFRVSVTCAFDRYLLIVFFLCATIYVCPADTLAEPDNRQSLLNDKQMTSRMEEVIVTGAHPLSIADIPRSISVLTAEDIELSGAQNIAELLAREANITLTSFSGNAKFTQLDIRGSGDTSVSNVLTLVDGIKINTPDLAGTDFSIIPLNQIARIEVIRGANSVRYGAGASQGVINIITKKPNSNSIRIKHEIGSYDSQTSNISAHKAFNNHVIGIDYLKSDSDSYRDFNRLKQSSAHLRYDGKPTDTINIKLKSQFYEDEYQLPGPLSVDELNNRKVNRRSANKAGYMEGIVEDELHLVSISFEPLSDLRIGAVGQHRERDTYFITSPNRFISRTDPETFRTTLNDTISELTVIGNPNSFLFKLHQVSLIKMQYIVALVRVNFQITPKKLLAI